MVSKRYRIVEVDVIEDQGRRDEPDVLKTVERVVAGEVFARRSKTRTKKDYAMKTLSSLAADIAKWSDKTFGTKEERGPLGPLKHLRKEVEEVIADIEAGNDPLEELADCLILLLDATRRSDLLARQLLEAAFIKMEKNRKRKWPKPTADGPVEHIRTCSSCSTDAVVVMPAVMGPIGHVPERLQCTKCQAIQ